MKILIAEDEIALQQSMYTFIDLTHVFKIDF